MSDDERLHQTLWKLFRILDEINNETYQGEELLSQRLAPFQTPEQLTEVQNAMFYYSKKKINVINQINRIRRLLGQ